MVDTGVDGVDSDVPMLVQQGTVGGQRVYVNAQCLDRGVPIEVLLSLRSGWAIRVMRRRRFPEPCI